MNIKNKKINIYIGLTTNKNKRLCVKTTLNLISRIFIKNKISGFSIYKINGFWNNKQERSLIISFINIYDLKYSFLRKMLIKLRNDLNQDSILIEVLNIPFEFI